MPAFPYGFLAGGDNLTEAGVARDNETLLVLYPSDLPDEMRFGGKNVLVIAVYVNLMWISLLGNSIVLWKLFYRKNRSRVHFMLLHLCVADILVTVIEMPLQIIWKSTVQWRGGDSLCRLLGGFRVVGLYLSAFLLIAISIDRFMSVWDPLSTVTKATCRAKTMVFIAWFLSLACASPQLTVWSLRTHPVFTWYEQCVTFEAFSTRSAELAYGLWITMLMYGFPLITIIICYLGIWLRISYYSKQTKQQESEGNFRRESRLPSTCDNVRRVLLPNDSPPPPDVLSKAKSRTLKMTVLVVVIFVLCWSPYQIIHIWYYFHRESAAKMNLFVQEILFIFGVSSCVVDPYVYGLYSMGLWHEIEFISKVDCSRYSRHHDQAKRVSFGAINGHMDIYTLSSMRKIYRYGRPAGDLPGPYPDGLQANGERRPSPTHMSTARITM